MDFLTPLFGRGGYLPHGYCFTWTPGLLWSMVGADGVIAAAYFSIPLAMVSFVRRRSDVATNWVVWLFIAFIFSCGITHVLDVWTIWRPDYGLQALSKVITAGISLVTAVALWPMVPKALKIPSARQFQSIAGSLEAEVGKRRRTEDQLVESQQSLAVTLTSIGAGFIAADRQGRVTRMNAVAERVLGWTEKQARGRNLGDVFKRESNSAGDPTLNLVDAMIERRITHDADEHFVAIARDGTRTTLDVKSALTYSKSGLVRGLALVFRDLTQLARAQAEASRLAAIVESSRDAIIGKTLDGRITSWNGAAQAMFGYSAAEIIGQKEPDAEATNLLASLATGSDVPAFDASYRTRDGRLLEVSVTISPVRDALGQVIGFSQIARDVSSQRRAESALRESEARLRFVLDSAQIGDWDLDFATGTSQRSLRHDRCFGYSAPQAEWSFETFARHVHPDDRPGVIARFDLAASALTDWRDECRVVWSDASVHWIRIHGSIRRQDGKPAQMVGIVTDISQQKLAEEGRVTAERLAAENRQMQEASRLKSQFLANMSHELRTPLNAIIGFAELLHAGAVPAESPKQREFLGHIGSSGRHLLQLINDVLDLSKVESGKFEFFPRCVDLGMLVREVCDVMQTASEHKHIAVATDVDPALTDLVLDPARFKQALYNYLSNAIKFTPEGGRVTVRARAEGATHFRLEVADTGIGIAASDLPRLFTEFSQIDGSHGKHQQGTGLGLSLTRRLVQAQGGSVGVRSEPGVGSVFDLVLRRDLSTRVTPVTDAEPATPPIEDGTADQGASEAWPAPAIRGHSDEGAAARIAIADFLTKPILAREVAAVMARLGLPQGCRNRVMVVDDDPLALDLMRTTLTGLDFDAICLQDGREAVRDIALHRPDAIVLDLMMPGFDGFAVLDALGARPQWRNTPVLIWTSMILTDDEYAGLARSARAILSKGGGELAVMLENLRRGRQPVTGQLPLPLPLHSGPS